MDSIELKLRNKLAKQALAVNQSEKELAYYESRVTENPNIAGLVTQVQTKLRRQLEAVKLTQLAIDIYTTPPKAAAKGR